MQTEQFLVEHVTEDDLIYARLLGDGNLFCLNWRQIISDLREQNIESPILSSPLRIPAPKAKLLLHYTEADRIAGVEVHGPTFLPEQLTLASRANETSDDYGFYYDELGDSASPEQPFENEAYQKLLELYSDALSIESGNQKQLSDFLDMQIDKERENDLDPPSKGMHRR